jgi:fructose-1,6-bisphosphatase
MIAQRLKTANETLEKLIEITKLDISSVKEAKHEETFSRVKTKEELVASFEKQKGLLDRSIAKAVEENPNVELSAVINQEERELLEKLKNSMLDLHKLNKRFASLVSTIGEFYSSLLSAILPSERSGYGAAKPSSASFLRIRG